jgi:acetyltransferase
MQEVNDQEVNDSAHSDQSVGKQAQAPQGAALYSFTPRRVMMDWPGIGPVQIRALGPADFEIEKAFVHSLGRQAIHQRTLGAIGNPTDDQIRQLVGIPHGSHMALAMIVGSAQGPQIVAVARYGPAQDDEAVPSLASVNRLSSMANNMSPALEDAEVTLTTAPEVARLVDPLDPPSAEFAIIVAEGWQGLGIARAMLSRLERVASRAGYRSMIGQTFFGNDSMLGLARKLGYRTSNEPGEPGIKRLAKRLVGRGFRRQA